MYWAVAKAVAEHSAVGLGLGMEVLEVAVEVAENQAVSVGLGWDWVMDLG